MSEIPYYFETPIPKYFRENQWFDNVNTILFVTWAFSKCSTYARTTVYDHKEITLAPYEFITGRGKSSAACFLSEDAFKHQLKVMQKAGLLKKTPNSTPNRFTCYVWVTERFSKPNPQLNAQLTPNSPPTERPQSRIKKRRSKEDHHPNPSSPKAPKRDDADLMIDDSLSIENEKKVRFEFVVNEVLKVVELSDADYKACLEIKGSHDNVQSAIDYILRSPGRKSAIQDWPNALRKWKIAPNVKSRAEANQARAQKLYEAFGNNDTGWRCEHYRCNLKDQIGILFFPLLGTSQPVFIAYSDPEFDQKVDVTLRDKKMQKGRIASS